MTKKYTVPVRFCCCGDSFVSIDADCWAIESSINVVCKDKSAKKSIGFLIVLVYQNKLILCMLVQIIGDVPAKIGKSFYLDSF